MPFEDSLYRQSIRDQARRAKEWGVVEDDNFPVTPMGTKALGMRENGRFFDQTGMSIIGFAIIETMVT